MKVGLHVTRVSGHVSVPSSAPTCLRPVGAPHILRSHIFFVVF
jgi:hypothetical protein